MVILPYQLRDIFSSSPPIFQVFDRPMHTQSGTTYIASHLSFPWVKHLPVKYQLKK